MIKPLFDSGKLQTIADFYHLRVSDLTRLDGVKETEGFGKLYPQMKEVLDTNKIKIEVKKMGNKLEGMTFCFTGKLETMKRAEAEQIVRDNGGQARSGVSGKLTYLVTNSTEPTAKYKKAKNQDTKIITEEEFLKMVKD